MNKNILILWCALLSGLLVSGTAADAVMRSTDEAYPSRLLRHTVTEIAVTIHGQVVETAVYGEFVNEWDRTTDAVYSFPLPADANATGLFYARNGGLYEAELRELPQTSVPGTGEGGFIAELNEYLGDNRVTMKLENIAPGQVQQVELRYIQKLPYDNARITYTFPLYTGDFMPNYLNTLGISVQVHHLAGAEGFRSGSHPDGWQEVRAEDTYHEYSYTASKKYLQQDFTFSYSLATVDFAAEFYSAGEQSADGHFAFSIFPNTRLQSDDFFSRNVVFLLDVSRSMAGFKLEQSCEAVKACIGTLDADDKFALYTFAYNAAAECAMLDATEANKTTALAKLDEIVSRTSYYNVSYLKEALNTAMTGFARDRYNNMVMVFTDGFSPCIPEEIDNPTDAGIFPVGLGSQISRNRMEAIAYAHNGMCAFYRETDPIYTGIIGFFNRINNPVLKNVSLAWSASGFNGMYPVADPVAFYNGCGFFVTGRYASSVADSVCLQANKVSGPMSRMFNFSLSDNLPGEDNSYLRRIWAAEKIRKLERDIEVYSLQDSLRDEVVALSLAYKVKCAFTSYWMDTSAMPLEESDGGDRVWTLLVEDELMPDPSEGMDAFAALFPNPLRGSDFSVQLTDPRFRFVGSVSLALFDADGHAVEAGMLVTVSDTRTLSITCGKKPDKGVYFLVIHTEQGTFTLRLMVV